MSTDLYGVRVLERVGRVLLLDVFCVYGDITFLPDPNNPHFFVQLLWDKNPGSAAAAARWPERLTDTPWLFENAARFIERVELLALDNYPGELEATFYYHRDGGWEGEERLPRGRYRVEAADVRWVDHLSAGQSWGTTCYQRAAPRTRAGVQRPDALMPAADFYPWEAGGVHDDYRHHPDGWRGRPSPAPDQLQALIELLSSADLRASGEAAMALGLLGAHAAAAVPHLCRAVSPDEASRLVRINALEALGRIGDPRGVASLVLAIHGGDWDIWAIVALQLARIGPAAQLAVGPLQLLSQHEYEAARCMAWLALHRITGSDETWERFVDSVDEGAGICLEYRLTQATALLTADELHALLPRLLPIIADEDMNAAELIYYIALLGPDAPGLLDRLAPHLTVGDHAAEYLEETRARLAAKPPPRS